LPFEVRDTEGDLVTAVVQWRTPAGSFPTLPDTLAELETLIATPGAAGPLQLATPFPRSAVGPAERLASDRLRLVDVAALAPFALAGDLLGKALELLVGSRFPTLISGQWSAPATNAPVGILPAAGGLEAFVLEPDGAGWILLQRDLASGDSSPLASGGGVPSALAAEPQGDRLLIASDLAGEWRLERLDLASGQLSLLYARAPSLPAGTVWGLSASGGQRAIVTVDDQLIEVHYPSGEPAVAASLLSGLAEPRGVVIDPRRPDWALLCERSGDQAGQPSGRISWVDLARRQRLPLAANDSQGLPLREPGALALDAEARRLFVHAAGTIYELPLGHLGGGHATALGDFAGEVRGLATGPDGLLLLAWTSASAVARAGGVRERQTIVAFDLALEAAQLAADSLHQPGDRWRLIEAGFPRLVATPSGVRASFAWDSRDLPPGTAGLLRIVPYDQDAGAAAQISAGKTPAQPLDVEPESNPADVSAVTQQARGLACADIDEDGDEDLIGIFPGLSAPAVLLTQVELGALTPRFAFSSADDDPLDLRLGDWDEDGDLDIAVANGGSSDLAIWWQSSGLNFGATPPLRLGGSSSTPGVLGLESADMDGDGRLDLLLAYTAGTAFFRSLGAGNFDAPLSLAGGAAAARVFDSNRDGDLDALLGNPGLGSGLRQQPQTAPGIFATSPSALTQAIGPVARRMHTADLDADGLFEIYVNDGASRMLGLEQTSSASFGASAGEVLLSGIGPGLSAGALASADVDQDGRPDLLVAARGSRRLLLFPSAGPQAGAGLPPGLAKAPLLVGPGTSFTGLSPASSGLCTVDLDGNGRLDCLLGAGGAVDRYEAVAAGRYDQPVNYSSLLSGALPRTALARDLDQDGAFDWLLSNSAGAPRLLHQRAPTIYEPETLAPTSPAVNALQVGAGDLDGDGRWDVLAGGGASLAVYLQDSDGSFPAGSSAVLTDPRFDFSADAGLNLTTVDWNQDGRLDVIGVSSARRSLLLIPNSSSGLDPAALLELPLAVTATPRQVQCADLDADGLLDLAVADLSGNRISVWRGTALGEFEPTPSGNLSAPFAYLLLSADLTGDGLPDLLTNTQSAAALWLLRGLPGGGFAAGEALPLPTTPANTFTRSLASGDLDGDGRADIAAKLDGTIARLLQVAPGRFLSAGPLLTSGPGTAGANSEGLHLLDLDGDGDPDLAAPGLSGQALAIYFASH
jgi:FG-GAP-like repeat